MYYNTLCSRVINDSYNRTSATLIGHSSSINIACSTFNASNSLLDIPTLQNSVRHRYHTLQGIVFIHPGVQEMSIIICASKVSVGQY